MYREADGYPPGVTSTVVPAVTHVRLKMRGPPSNGSAGALRIYDVAINARDPEARQEGYKRSGIYGPIATCDFIVSLTNVVNMCFSSRPSRGGIR